MTHKFLSNDGAVVATLLILGIVCVLALAWSFRPTMDGYEWQEEIYTVQQGDSLVHRRGVLPRRCGSRRVYRRNPGFERPAEQPDLPRGRSHRPGSYWKGVTYERIE